MPHPSHRWPYDDTEMKIHLAQSGLTNILLMNEKKTFMQHAHIREDTLICAQIEAQNRTEHTHTHSAPI